MQHQLILVVGLFLSSCLPGEAQTLATPAFLAQARPEPTTMLVRASLTHFPPKVSLTSLLPGKPVAPFTVLFIPAYMPDHSLESRSLVEEIRTPFLTESHVVIVQFWRGRLQLDGFESTLHMQNVQFGPPGSGDLLPPSSDQAGVTRSLGLDGISLVFRFGRDAQTRRQPQVWRCLARIRGDSRGCPL